MDHIAPPYEMCIEVAYGLKSGQSLRLAIQNYVQRTQTDWTTDLVKWVWALDHGNETASIKNSQKSSYRRHLLELLERGLKGVPVLPLLEDFEGELAQACKSELHDHLQQLPFKMTLIMLLLQLPSYLIVLLGPLLFRLAEGMQL